ncbi:MAG: (d)CMP kinase [Alphaproteobacteria bacterium]|nr:(d)CMP kinase [Alphaproteobacteria bacterium]
MIIAIDGPTASGKGTIAKRVAAHYGFHLLDTGLLYRAVARAVLDVGQSLEDSEAATTCARKLDFGALDESRLRTREIGDAASVVSAYPGVRQALFEGQRLFAQKKPGAVLDGRDIGTVICPEAEAKLFITASSEIRAHRRWLELVKLDPALSEESILADIRRRDERDSNRSNAPLKIADDARLLDTSLMDIETASREALRLIEASLSRQG